MTVLSEFLSNHLEPDSLRVHRVGRPKHLGKMYIVQAINKQNKRPLIVMFRDYQDVELILSKAGKLKCFSFRSNWDFSPRNHRREEALV